MMNKNPLLTLITVLSLATLSLQSAVHTVTSPAEFSSAVATAQPGDTIQLPSGSLADWGQLLVNTSGAQGNPIVISGPSVYATTLTGNTWIEVTGAFITIAGLKFDGTTGTYPVYFNGGRDGSVTQCYFANASASTCIRGTYVGSDPESGSRLTITNNYFTDSSANSITLVGPSDLSWTGQHVIARNVFRDSPPRASGGETIVLWSNGDHLGYNLNSSIEYNVFDNWDADSSDEIFSLKSGNNTVAGNVFAYCDGYMSLRRENGNWIEGNFMYKCLEGIRIYGENHVVINNVFQDCAQFGIHMGQGWENSSISKPARNCVVANNTLWNIAKRPFYFPLTSTPNADPDPKNNLLANNIVHSENSTNELVRDQLGFFNAGNNNTVTNNVYYTQSGNYGPLGINYQQAQAQLVQNGTDVHLGAASPAINFATNVAEVTLDYFGQDRSAVSLRDAGHHEHELAATPSPVPALPPVPEDRAFNQTQPRLAKLVLYPDGSDLAIGEIVNIDGAYSDGDNTTFAFDFGDGNSYTGSESFITHAYQQSGNYDITLTVSGPGGSDFVVVPVVVGGGAPNNSPIAVNDAYSTDQDVVLNVPAPGVLGNDSDPDQDPITVDLASVTAASSGTVNIATDGSFTYSPNPGFNGADSFTYQATDGALNSGSATVNLTVNAPAATCHVQSMTPYTVNVSKGFKHGAVSVVIVDANSSPVANATVNVSFSGDYNETVQGVTDGSGTVELLTTSTVKGGVSFSVCVDSVTHAALVYNSAENLMTCTSF